MGQYDWYKILPHPPPPPTHTHPTFTHRLQTFTHSVFEATSNVGIKRVDCISISFFLTFFIIISDKIYYFPGRSCIHILDRKDAVWTRSFLYKVFFFVKAIFQLRASHLSLNMMLGQYHENPILTLILLNKLSLPHPFWPSTNQITQCCLFI